MCRKINFNVRGFGKDFLLMSKVHKVKLNGYQINYIYWELCRLQHEYKLSHDGEESSLINSIFEALL